MRADAASRGGRLTHEQQVSRVAAALALIRGERRATVGDRMDAARWLFNKGWGPPADAPPLEATAAGLNAELTTDKEERP